MLRVKSGHYRDTFGGFVYDVRRCHYPLGTRNERGWEFVILGTGYCSPIWPTKQRAQREAWKRLAVYTDALEG